MIKDRLYLKNGESKLIRMISIKHLVLIKSHYSKKLNLDVTICFPVIQKGCQFCEDYCSDRSEFGLELQRRYNLMFMVIDNDCGMFRLLFTKNEENDVHLLNSFKKYSNKFETHFLRLSRKNDYYSVKPIRYMNVTRKKEFERLNELAPTVEWVVDCTPILNADEISELIEKLKLKSI